MAQNGKSADNAENVRDTLKIGQGGDQKGKTRMRLRPVALGNIPWGTEAPVDLYLNKGKEPSLLFRKSQGLSSDAYAEISKVTDRLYHDKTAEVNWQDLVESNLSAILDSPLPTEGKAAVAYGSAARQTQHIFEEFNEEGYAAAGETVDAMNKLMNERRHGKFLQLTVHDYYTYTHSVHVYIYSSLLTRAIIGDENDALLKELGIGFLLHDIGKKDISPAILNKKGKLDDEEWEEIKKHLDTGYNLLTQVSGSLSDEVAQIVLQHHEKIDGSGYPKGLKDSDIGRFGKICGVADVYDALTTRRSYKEAMSKMTAFTIMQDSPGHFDENLLSRFIRLAVPYLE
jgi:HD-GYP domain-containing protein (c-di-GMP phosphodiesterase class II)